MVIDPQAPNSPKFTGAEFLLPPDGVCISAPVVDTHIWRQQVSVTMPISVVLSLVLGAVAIPATMSWRRRGGRSSALQAPNPDDLDGLKPLSRSKPRAALSPVRRPDPGRNTDMSSSGLKMSEEEMRRARQQFEENQAKASLAASRAQQKQREAEDARIAQHRAMQQDHSRIKRELELQQEKKQAQESKASPVTAVQAQPSKRFKVATSNCRLVWDELDTPGGSFVDIALRDGPCKPMQNPKNFAHDAICDGLVIVMENGFTTKGLEPCKWYHSGPWRELASKVDAIESPGGRIKLQSDGGVGMRKIGAGTFNVVVSVDKQHLPSWVPENSVLRITRPDRENKDSEYKYQTMEMIKNEAENAMYASANGFGVRVHAIAPFNGLRCGRGMRYGTVYVLDRAEKDLFRQLESMSTRAHGMTAAKNVTEMLFKASRCGVAFHDIKPGNILTYPNMVDSYKLTDYDPAFFVVLPDADWRALLLLNLALLSCHVRNAAFGPVSWGWATAVKPILMQLISRKDEYDSKWLFEARSVNILFDYSKSKSDFDMQRMMSIMATSYFYGKTVPADASSKRWNWETKDQAALDSHWKVGVNRNSWPKEWPSNYRPLINQMVEFAVERADP